MPVVSIASVATTWCGQYRSHVAPEDMRFEGFKFSGPQLGKCTAGTQTKELRSIASEGESRKKGVAMVVFQGPLMSTHGESSPVTETRWGMTVGHAMVTDSAACFPSAPPLTPFLMPKEG